mgnify:FL=1
MGIYLIILLSLIFLVLLFIILNELPYDYYVVNFYLKHKAPLLLLFSLINILIYSISIYLVYIYLF